MEEQKTPLSKVVGPRAYIAVFSKKFLDNKRVNAGKQTRFFKHSGINIEIIEKARELMSGATTKFAFQGDTFMTDSVAGTICFFTTSAVIATAVSNP